MQERETRSIAPIRRPAYPPASPSCERAPPVAARSPTAPTATNVALGGAGAPKSQTGSSGARSPAPGGTVNPRVRQAS